MKDDNLTAETDFGAGVSTLSWIVRGGDGAPDG
jgi:hypothetical protein